jgi:hypothetical protein
MPVALPAIVGALAPNFASVGILGVDVPKLCAGIANGLVQWVPTVQVVTVDAGVAGVGSNVPTPVVAPQPLLLANLMTGMAGQGLVGIFVPLFVQGLSTGLMTAFLQMLVKTNHPVVGIGTGVGKYVAPPSGPAMIAGLTSAGVIGISAFRLGLAIGVGLDVTFASLVVPVVIVGSGSPVSTGGAGLGNIV